MSDPIPSCIHAAQHHSEGKTMVVCRIPKHDEVSLTTALDAGAAGLVIPHTDTAQDVRDKVKEIFYRTSCFPSPPFLPPSLPFLTPIFS